MSTFEAIVLGVVQGLTEFLPISSSGHLRVVPAFLGWDDPGAGFTAVIQLGTMAAVLLYFREDLWRIARASLRGVHDRAARGDPDARMGWYIAIGTIPIAVFGFAFRHPIESSARDLYLIGSTLIAFGLLLLLAEKVSEHRREMDEANERDALAIGLAQAMALVPGVSRSGATITAGLFLGFERAAAARFSFLLSVPAVVLSGLFEMRKIGEESAPVAPTVVATVLAFVSGYLAIAFLLRFLVSHTTYVFVVYRVALGAAVIALVAAGAIS